MFRDGSVMLEVPINMIVRQWNCVSAAVRIIPRAVLNSQPFVAPVRRDVSVIDGHSCGGPASGWRGTIERSIRRLNEAFGSR